MRLFIGTGLPTPVAEALAKSATSLVVPSSATRIRWTPPVNMHVTLSFLGQVHEARLDVIQQALATIRAPHMKLSLEGFGTFDRVGVLYAGVKKSPALLALAEQVMAAMQAVGFPREDRPYSPTSPSPAAAIASACALMQKTTPLSAQPSKPQSSSSTKASPYPKAPVMTSSAPSPSTDQTRRYP